MTVHCILCTDVAIRSVTLIGEIDRKMLKAVIKYASRDDMVRHRQIPADSVAKWSQRLEGLKSEISEVMNEEREEKQVMSCSCSVQYLV